MWRRQLEPIQPLASTFQRWTSTRVFTGWTRRARISWPEHGRQLDIEAEAPLDFLVLYTPPGEPFFCAEPVSNITDAFNRADDAGINTGGIVLAPGQMRSASVRFIPSQAV